MTDLEEAVVKRFPNAQFEIKVFKTMTELIDDIPLVRDFEILYTDEYMIDGETYTDFYRIKRNSCEEYIFVSDVINQITEQGFLRRQFPKMLDIRETYLHKRNRKSMRVFCSTWSE